MEKNENNLKHFMKQGYSRKLSLFLIERFPPLAFGGGYLEDHIVEERYNNWINETIK